MLANLDPLGMPIATKVVSGETDDGLYIQYLIRQTLQTLGLLWVGDCKMSALATRAHIHHHQHLLPDALNTGGQSARIQQWIAEALAGNSAPRSLCQPDPD